MELERARQELQEILQSPEYQVYYHDDDVKQSFWANWLDGALKSLGELWSRVVPEQSGLSEGLSYLSLFIIGVAVLLFIIALVLVIRQVSGGKLWREDMGGAAMSRAMTLRAYLEEARRYEGAQNYEQAIRALFAGLLVFLQEKGWIETKSWKTNGDYSRELQSRPKEATDLFYCLAYNYEETVYGGLPLKPEIYRLCREQVESCLGQEVTE